MLALLEAYRAGLLKPKKLVGEYRCRTDCGRCSFTVGDGFCHRFGR